MSGFPTLANDLLAFPTLLGRVSLDIVAAPCRWGLRDWIALFALLGVTLFAYGEKRPIQALIEHPDDGALHRLARFAEIMGNGGASVCYGATTFVIGRCSKRRVWVDMALTLATGGIWCSALTKVGQFVLAEARPSDGGVMHFLAGDGHGVSGHASAVALVYVATHDILTRNAPRMVRRAVGTGLLAWVVIVGWSRVYLGAHFVWNVVLGLAIGHFTGSVAARTCIASRATLSERPSL